MSCLNTCSTSKSWAMVSFRWVLMASAFAIFLFALSSIFSPNLLTLPIQFTGQTLFSGHMTNSNPCSLSAAQASANGYESNSNRNSITEDILFTEFGAVRRTVSEIIFMLVSAIGNDTKITYLGTSNKFIRERLESLSRTNKHFWKDLENFGKVESSFDVLKQYENQSSEADRKLFDKYLEMYLMEIGTWLEKLTKTYKPIMKSNSEKCLRNMKILEDGIERKIYDVQHGELCEKSTSVLHLSDLAKSNPKPHRWTGMGTVLHRIETCTALSLQIGSPCIFGDHYLEYDHGNLAKYYNDTKPCSSALKRNNIETLISLQIREHYKNYVLNVPLEVKTALDYCHEDPVAWYRGVILKHMLHFTNFSENYVTKLIEETKIRDSIEDMSQITSVHIRSTEKKRYERVLPAPPFFYALKYLCLVRKHLCNSKITWVATDDNKNWGSFNSLLKNDPTSINQFQTFGLNVSEKEKRNSPHGLMQFLAEVRVISNAKLTIGNMFSNLLLYTYEMKSVDDPMASDRTISLDHFFNPFIQTRQPNFLIISPNFLFTEPTNATKWPQEITINNDRVLTNYVQLVMEKGVLFHSPEMKWALVKATFVNRDVFKDHFYTPFFNLRKITEAA